MVGRSSLGGLFRPMALLEALGTAPSLLSLNVNMQAAQANA